MNLTNPILSAAAGLLLVVTPAAAEPPERTPETIETGKAQFTANCVMCHGERGDGSGAAAATLTPKPRNFRTEAFKFGSKPEQIVETLGKGSPGTAMAAFPQLSEEQKYALAYYILSMREEEARLARKGKGKRK